MFRTLIGAAAFLLFAGLSSGAFASDFCDGFKAGYQEGYCYHQAGCFKPFPPFCPFPNFGEDTFQDGYNRGFLDGLAAKN